MSLIAELKRRNVFRVGAAYAIVAWLLIEVAHTAFPTLQLPDWTTTLVTVLLIMGFPVALVIAWAFEMTPEGIKREKDVVPAESITHVTGRKLDFAIIGLLALAVVFLVVDNYVLEDETGQTSVAREKSIAVLPFANISPNPDDAYFADGIHDEVLAQLSKIRELKVISRTSVMGYSGRNRPPLPEIAAALGVANILEGSVRLAGNQVRITTQLIEAESDAHLWTETYDRELTAANIFSIQSEIAKTVADALQAELLPKEEQLLDTVPTENMAALEAYFRGKQRMERRTSAALAESIEYFQEAINHDPEFALAYVALADTYTVQVYWSSAPRAETLAKAETAANKALELNDHSGEAHTSLAGVLAERREFAAAERMFRRAIELSPGYAQAYHWYALMLSEQLGRSDEALSLSLKAAELDPLSPIVIVSLGARLEAVGRFQEALDSYERSLELDPKYAIGAQQIADYHRTVTGNLDQAVGWYRRAIALDSSQSGYPALLADTLLDLGDPVEAAYWIDRAVELAPDRDWPITIAQHLHLYRNDERAVVAAREAFSNGAFNSPYLVLLREHHLNAGRYAEARALLEEASPEFLREDKPDAGCQNFWWGNNLAAVLLKTDERERADLLLDKSWQCIQNRPRRGRYGYGIADVEVLALRGQKQKALSALRQAIDAGWRSDWWFLEREPSLESLHDEPEYQAMVAEIEADMAAQLARVREMERNGELEPIPEASATTH